MIFDASPSSHLKFKDELHGFTQTEGPTGGPLRPFAVPPSEGKGDNVAVRARNVSHPSTDLHLSYDIALSRDNPGRHRFPQLLG